MEETMERYYVLKQQQKDIEQKLSELRTQIIEYCQQNEQSAIVQGGYKARIIAQERREYDDQKLYAALPDADVWRLISKADPAKIASLVKLDMINERALRGTYALKKITSLQVERI